MAASSRLKIGFVLDDGLDSSDGVQQYITTLGEWLTQQGHEVHYLVGQTKRTDIQNLHSLSRNVRVGFNQNRLTIPLPANKRAIAALLANEKFDVLHVQMPYSPFLAGRIIKAAPSDTAVIATFHVLLASKAAHLAARGLGMLEHASLRRLDSVISVSKPAQVLAKSAFGLESAVIPNAVNYQNFSHGKKLAQFDDARKNIVFLGRLVKRKGAAYLLWAFAESSIRDKARLILVGKGPLQSELESLSRSLGVQDRVHFTGYIEEAQKSDYLASADLAVFPSTGGESFGIVLIEAMAAGAGVVLAGNNPGYATVMENHAEVLFDPKQTNDLAQKLAELLNNPDQAKEIHDWQQMIVAQYDVGKVGARVLAVYRAALRSKAKVR